MLSFVQIGDTKYGKSVLDRLADHDLALDDAWVLAVISIDEAVRANVSVGYPIDMATLEPGSHVFAWSTLNESDELVMLLRRQWQDGIVSAFAKVDRALSPLGDHLRPGPADDPTA